jgi:hypothetical protein
MQDSCRYRGGSAAVNTFPTTPVITGYTLALSKSSAAYRAFRAGDLVLGHCQLIYPRVTQAARLARVSTPYALAAIELLRSGVEDLILAAKTGKLPLLKAAVLARHPRKSLAETYLAADADERLDLGRIVAVETVFDTAISPLL